MLLFMTSITLTFKCRESSQKVVFRFSSLFAWGCHMKRRRRGKRERIEFFHFFIEQPGTTNIRRGGGERHEV